MIEFVRLAAKSLLDVGKLLLLIFVFYAVIGVHLFMGRMGFRCMSNEVERLCCLLTRYSSQAFHLCQKGPAPQHQPTHLQHLRSPRVHRTFLVCLLETLKKDLLLLTMCLQQCSSCFTCFPSTIGECHLRIHFSRLSALRMSGLCGFTS